MSSNSYTHDDPTLSGLDDLAANMPVTDTDALEKITQPLTIGKPPEWWLDEVGADMETGEPALAFAGTREQTRVSNEDVERNQMAVLDTVKDDYWDDVDAMIAPDELEVGECQHFGNVELTFKRIDGWALTRYEISLFDEVVTEEFVQE
jgi:hypothetical protein